MIKIARKLIPLNIDYNTDSMFSRLDINIFILILVPIVFSLSNVDWIYGAPGMSDHWINYNFFQDFFHDQNINNGQFPYKFTRVSHLLYGYLIHKIFSPIPAYYFYFFSLFYLSTICFYVIISQLFNKHVAIITSIMLCCYTHFHGSISFESMYQNYSCLAYFMASLMFAVLAAKKPQYKLYLFLSGIFYASAIHQLLYASYLPSLIIIYAGINYINNKNSLVESLKWFALGAITITIVFSAISYMAQGMTFFLFVQVLQSLFFIEIASLDAYKNILLYWQPLWKSLWAAKSSWLVYLSAAVGMLAILAISLKKKLNDKYYFTCFILIAGFEVAFLFHLIQHAFGRAMSIGHDYMIYPILPLLFIAIATFYSFLSRNPQQASGNRLVAYALLVSILPLVTGITNPIEQKTSGWIHQQTLKIETFFDEKGNQ